MKVLCIDGYEDILTEGQIYTVVEVSKKGNYILEEVNIPEPYTSFHSSRFVPVEDDPNSIWTEEMEKQFWSEQPSTTDI
jgi:hypothetical protein